MKEKSYKLFEDADIKGIVTLLSSELELKNESPIWRDRVVPFCSAILSVLVPLNNNNLLFTPEGEHVDKLTPELFFRWSDFVSLKTLFFTIKRSNEAGKLLRIKMDDIACRRYKHVELKEMEDYLRLNNVNLENESLDFPIAVYNLHQGVSNVIKSLL